MPGPRIGQGTRRASGGQSGRGTPARSAQRGGRGRPDLPERAVVLRSCDLEEAEWVVVQEQLDVGCIDFDDADDMSCQLRNDN